MMHTILRKIGLNVLVLMVMVAFAPVTGASADRLKETDKIAIAKLKKAGWKCLQLAAGERERFRKATEGVQQVFVKQMGSKGKELLDLLKADIAKYGK